MYEQIKGRMTSTILSLTHSKLNILLYAYILLLHFLPHSVFCYVSVLRTLYLHSIKVSINITNVVERRRIQ